MGDAETHVGQGLSQARGGAFDGLDPVVQEEDLAAPIDLSLDGPSHHTLVVGAHVGLDGVTVFGRRLDHRDVANTGERHLQGARDRGRGQGESVDLELEVAERLFLGNAEPLLLVHDHHAQVFRGDVLGKEPMRTYEHVHLALGELAHDAALLLGRTEPGDHLHFDRELPHPLAEGAVVLLREDGGGHEHHDLFAVHSGFEGGTQGDLGLAVAHVPAHQAIHRLRTLHVVLDLVDGAALVDRLHVGKGQLETTLPLSVLREGVSRGRLPDCIEPQQLAGHLPDRGPRPVLDLCPGLAAQLGE